MTTDSPSMSRGELREARPLSRRELRMLEEAAAAAVPTQATRASAPEPELAPLPPEPELVLLPPEPRDEWEPELAFEPEPAFEPRPAFEPEPGDEWEPQLAFETDPSEPEPALVIPRLEGDFGAPAVLMYAPVMPALQPLDLLEHQMLPLEERIAALPVAPGAIDLPDVRAAAFPAEPIDGRAAAARPGPAPQAAGPQPVAVPMSAPRPAAARPAAQPVASAPVGPVEKHGMVIYPPSPWQAVLGMWVGIAAILVWVLGPVALGLGIWTLQLASKGGHGKARPITAIIGGTVGTALGVLFLTIGI